jgi:putative DNA-invertase from lambdoid prophage Rac
MSREQKRKRELRRLAQSVTRPPGNGPVAFGYGRVSTMRQVIDGHSPEMQEKQVLAYYDFRLKPQGFQWGGFLHDKAVSGKIAFRERNAGRALWVALKPGDALLIAKLDRAFRSLLDQIETVEKLIEMGVQVHFLDLNIDTASEVGRMHMGIMATIAEYERSRLRTRSTEGVAMSILKGVYPTHVPWGMRVSKPFGRPRIVWDWDKRNQARHYIQERKAGGGTLAGMMARLMPGGEPGSKAYKKIMTRAQRMMLHEINLIAYCSARARLLGLADPDQVPPPTAYELFISVRDKWCKVRMVLDAVAQVGHAHGGVHEQPAAPGDPPAPGP